MCGITGVVHRDGSPVDAETLRHMTALVSHRGPDGEGIFVAGSVGLGHRRLAILDLTEAGHQPMSRDEDSLVITFNGEIYNYVELRAQLSAMGHGFRTDSDTEVLLAAYAQWGTHCVDHFNGMWAFAILDRRRQLLFCSRDRFGEKPFYYLSSDRFFAFASEIRQLLPLLGRRVANRNRVLRFLIANLAEGVEDTFFEGVRKLSAGSNLLFDLARGTFLVDRYYSVSTANYSISCSEDEAAEQLKSLLTDSISLRLRADVTVGTCLSGGLDSSSIAAIAGGMYRSRTGRPFSAITAKSQQIDRDESVFASQVVAACGLRGESFMPLVDDFRAVIDDVFEAQEEPFPSASIIMQFFVMREAKRLGIPVLLDGQGGDETLLGYERYFAAHFLGEAKNHGWLAALKDMMSGRTRNATVSPTKLAGLFFYFNYPLARWLNYRRRNSYIRPWPAVFPEIFDYASASRDIKTLQTLEIEVTNLPALLRYEDKNAMRHSVETRLPFLDHRLVEFALQLAGRHKLRDGWTKYVLRRAMTAELPNEVVWRTRKLGFEAPEQIWFTDFRQNMLDEIERSPLLDDFADTRRLRESARAFDTMTLWRLFSVARWSRLAGLTT